MDYYKEIKNKLINNEVYKKVKDYSKNRNDLQTYYVVGKLLNEAGKKYGESIIENYSKKLTIDMGKGYSWRNLYNMKLYYLKIKDNLILQTLSAKLTWSHITELLKFDDMNKICYYANIIDNYNLSVRELRKRIKNSEYERLPEKTRNKLIYNNDINIEDNIKNPIMIKNRYNTAKISEKMLQELIINDISLFLEELGEGYSFIKNEYKIKVGDRYNYIDILLYNYIYKRFVVVELKVTELKKEHIGQINFYMKYIDDNIKDVSDDDTIGIIIVKKENRFVIEYSSDEKIFQRKYILV